MEVQNRSHHPQKLQATELEAACGAGFWKDASHTAGVLAHHAEQFLEQAVEGIYNIGTTGSP